MSQTLRPASEVVADRKERIGKNADKYQAKLIAELIETIDRGVQDGSKEVVIHVDKDLHEFVAAKLTEAAYIFRWDPQGTYGTLRDNGRTTPLVVVLTHAQRDANEQYHGS